MNFNVYSEFRAKIKKAVSEGKTPVVFSNRVLDDPELRRDIDFWNLEGLHVHTCYLHEISKKLGYVLSQEVKAKRPEGRSIYLAHGFDLIVHDYFKDLFNSDTEDHLKKLKGFLGIEAEIGHVALTTSFGNHITYYWLNDKTTI